MKCGVVSSDGDEIVVLSEAELRSRRVVFLESIADFERCLSEDDARKCLNIEIKHL